MERIEVQSSSQLAYPTRAVLDSAWDQRLALLPTVASPAG